MQNKAKPLKEEWLDVTEDMWEDKSDATFPTESKYQHSEDSDAHRSRT